MFSIGEFSKITRLPIKTLRYYHERNLLVPAHVESGSGYRFYNDRNVERARIIVLLRSLEFSLEQISEILDECDEDADVLEFLDQRRQSVLAEVRRQKEIASRLDRIIQQQQQSRKVMSTINQTIREITVDPMLIAGIRMQGKYSDCGKGFAKLGKNLGRQINGTAFCMFYDEGYRENDADFEACFPIKKAVNKDGIECRELPGGRFLSLVHKGPYDEVGPTYQAIISYAKDKGLEIKVPCREIYIKGPGMIFKGNPKKYITEVQMPIAE